ncbi:MAG: alkaline phosphatase family protein [Gemmatimonadota bacterium]
MIRIASTAFLASFLWTVAGAQTPPREKPALIVFIAVDQLRADYLERFRSQWTGGFARMLRSGAVFTQGMQDHAITETAPGHSTMLSGRDPAHTGIVTNDLGVGDSTAPVLGAPGAPGASPRRFVGTELYDWLLAVDHGTRVFSVSRKDRGAILPVGRAKAPIFWWAGGRFTTSSYYADSLPGWVGAYDRMDGLSRLAGTTWTLLLPASAYPEADSMKYEHGGKDFVFPHQFASTVDSVRAQLAHFPWMDSLTLDFALEGARQLKLGQRHGGRTGPDLLAVSLSTTDDIGHTYGPDSRELHDHLLRLDRWLGWFLDSLGTAVPRSRLLVVLTADHGVTSFPEFEIAHGRPGGRVSLQGLVHSAESSLDVRAGHRGGGSSVFSLDFDTGLLLADTVAVRKAGISVDSLAKALAAEAARVPGVAGTWTPSTLARTASTDVNAARWRRSLPSATSWLFCASLLPGYQWGGGAGSTSHGSTNQDDVLVPIVFLGAGVRPGVLTRAVRTTDIAPTIARLIGVRPLEALDGVVLPEVLAGRPGARR